MTPIHKRSKRFGTKLQCLSSGPVSWILMTSLFIAAYVNVQHSHTNMLGTLDIHMAEETVLNPPITTDAGILIGVTTSRATFPTRVKEAMSTWARNLPANVFVRFFVGDLPEDKSSLGYSSGSVQDIQNLAKQGDISDISTIVVMRNVDDKEYPLVHKASAVLEKMQVEAHKLGSSPNDSPIKWYFDIDDDTYVNVKGLNEFLRPRDPNDHLYMGQRGTGAKKDREMLAAAGMTKPFCMGGPGILFSKATFEVLVKDIKKCIADAAKVFESVYDDVVIGFCLQRSPGMECYGEKSYISSTFAHDYDGKNNFPENSKLNKTLSLHPHKTPGMMTYTHNRFTKYASSKPSRFSLLDMR